jgi:hypothetical protein
MASSGWFSDGEAQGRQRLNGGPHVAQAAKSRPQNPGPFSSAPEGSMGPAIHRPAAQSSSALANSIPWVS